MSDILIKGMEMPFVGSIKTIVIYPDGTVRTRRQDPLPYTAVPVPPHGRLIDADALAEHKFVCVPHVIVNDKEAGVAYRLGWNTAIEAIMENAETVIGGE